MTETPKGVDINLDDKTETIIRLKYDFGSRLVRDLGCVIME